MRLSETAASQTPPSALACSNDGEDAGEPPNPPGGSLTAARAAARAGLQIRREGTGEDLLAARCFGPGELVFEFRNVTWRPARDRLTVEHPNGHHFFDPLLARVSHSCDPNTRASAQLMALVARRPIAPGDVVTYDFLSTETAIADPFLCRCGSVGCRGWIAGPS
jgi:hypothetical protein